MAYSMEVYRETVNRQGKSRGEKKVGLQRSFLFLHSSPFIHSFIYFEIFLSNCFFLEIFIPNSTILHFVSSPTSNPASKDHTRPFPVFCNAHAYFPLPRTYIIVVISCYCYFFYRRCRAHFFFFRRTECTQRPTKAPALSPNTRRCYRSCDNKMEFSSARRRNSLQQRTERLTSSCDYRVSPKVYAPMHKIVATHKHGRPSR